MGSADCLEFSITNEASSGIQIGCTKVVSLLNKWWCLWGSHQHYGYIAWQLALYKLLSEPFSVHAYRQLRNILLLGRREEKGGGDHWIGRSIGKKWCSEPRTCWVGTRTLCSLLKGSIGCLWQLFVWSSTAWPTAEGWCSNSAMCIGQCLSLELECLAWTPGQSSESKLYNKNTCEFKWYIPESFKFHTVTRFCFGFMTKSEVLKPQILNPAIGFVYRSWHIGHSKFEEPLDAYLLFG